MESQQAQITELMKLVQENNNNTEDSAKLKILIKQQEDNVEAMKKFSV